jgi:hypothetical protein
MALGHAATARTDGGRNDDLVVPRYRHLVRPIATFILESNAQCGLDAVADHAAWSPVGEPSHHS